MLHKREVLLEAVKAQLIAAATDCAGRISRGKDLPVENVELPAACFYQGPEANEQNDVETYKQRKVDVIIDVHAKSTPADLNQPEIETVLNALALQFENALEADAKLGGAAMWIDHIATDNEIVEGEADRGVVKIIYRAQYRTLRLDASA